MERTSVWWLNPVCIVGGFTGTVAVLAHLISASTYLSNWNTPKFLDESSLLLTLTCLACFSAAALLFAIPGRVATPVAAPLPCTMPERPLRKLFYVSYALTLCGYLLWVGLAVSRGLNAGVILAFIKGQDAISYTIRQQYLQNISGATTCTQFGISTVILAVLLGPKLKRSTLIILAVPFFGLTLARALLNSERLALVEVIVPLGVSLVHAAITKTSISTRSLAALKLLPLGGLVALVLVFGTFEYFRSWVVFYAGGDQSFVEFTISRLLGYYVTALNNGACLWRSIPQPLGMPLSTLGFAWKLPLLGDLFKNFLPNNFNITDYFAVLSRNANPEFNNAGGLMLPLVDFGVLGGLLYWFLAGLVCGYLYKQFKANNAWGVCLYPFVFISLLEVPRGLHWADGRAFPAFCFLVLSATILRTSQTRIPIRNVFLPDENTSRVPRPSSGPSLPISTGSNSPLR